MKFNIKTFNNIDKLGLKELSSDRFAIDPAGKGGQSDDPHALILRSQNLHQNNQDISHPCALLSSKSERSLSSCISILLAISTGTITSSALTVESSVSTWLVLVFTAFPEAP